MSKVNQIKQALIEAKGLQHSRNSALTSLLEEQSRAKATYHGLLDKQTKGSLSDDDKKTLTSARATYEGFEDRLSAARTLATEAERDTLRLEQDLVAEEKRVAGLPTTSVDAPTKIEVVKDNRTEAPWKSLGEQLVAVHRAAVSPHDTDPRLFKAAATGMGEQALSDGGFLVVKDVSTQILERTYAIGELAQRVFKLPLSAQSNGMKIPAIDETSRADGSRWGGVQGYWVAEGVAPTAGKPKIRQIELELRKVAALVYATDELVADATALEALVMRVLPEELNFKVEDAIVNGSGAGMPLGYVNSGAVISVAKETGQASGTIQFENIVKMWSRMWGRSRSSAIWLINQDCEPQLFAMSKNVGTGGVPVFMPANGLADRPYSTLFGRPIIPVEYCATVGTVGDIQLVDPSQYLCIDKGSIQSAASMHVRFINDEMTYRFTYRVDGQPTWNSPLTPKNGTNTLSPFITLATR